MEAFAPSSTAVVIVDVQNDFCAPGGRFAQFGLDMTAARAVPPRLQAIIRAARRSAIPVFYVKTEGTPDMISEAWIRHFGPEGLTHCLAGSWGADFFELDESDADYIISKARYSPFIGTALEQRLRTLNRTHVVVGGVATNVCVETTVRDAFNRDFDVTVVSDGCAAYSPAEHAASLEAMGRYFASVRPLAEILEAWAASHSEPVEAAS